MKKLVLITIVLAFLAACATMLPRLDYGGLVDKAKSFKDDTEAIPFIISSMNYNLDFGYSLSGWWEAYQYGKGHCYHGAQFAAFILNNVNPEYSAMPVRLTNSELMKAGLGRDISGKLPHWFCVYRKDSMYYTLDMSARGWQYHGPFKKIEDYLGKGLLE